MLIPLLLAAAIEIPLAPHPIVSMPTAASRVALASAGPRMLAAWVDGRNRIGVFATRLTRDGQALDRDAIRILPNPTRRYFNVETPATASLGDLWIVAFAAQRRDHSEILLTRMARDGRLLDREPRVITEGSAPRLTSNGTTLLLTWQPAPADPRTDYQTKGLLFSTDSRTMGDLPPLKIRTTDVAPRRNGYVIAGVDKGNHVATIRVQDDGQVAGSRTFGEGYEPMTASADDGDTLLLYLQREGTPPSVSLLLRDVLIDANGRTTAQHTLGRCDEYTRLGGVVRTRSGFMAIANCTGAVQMVNEPPPPMYDLYTIDLGPDGAPRGIVSVASRTTGLSLIAGPGGFYANVMRSASQPYGAKIARVEPGRLFPSIPVSFGVQELQAEGLSRDGNGSILAIWRGGHADPEVGFVASRLLASGVDPSFRARPVEQNTATIAEWSGSDGVHRVTLDTSPNKQLRITRTSLNGSGREEVSLPTTITNRSSIQCNKRGCLVVWTDFVEKSPGKTLFPTWALLVPRNGPLRSSPKIRIASDTGFNNFPMAGAASDGFIVQYSNEKGEVRAATLATARLRVTHDILLSRSESQAPFGVAGGGDDGFEIVINAWPAMQAYRIDAAGTVRKLGAIGNGDARFVVRSGGRGYVLYERDHDVFATITE